jgi:hypothetical protein
MLRRLTKLDRVHGPGGRNGNPPVQTAVFTMVLPAKRQQLNVTRLLKLRRRMG